MKFQKRKPIIQNLYKHYKCNHYEIMTLKITLKIFVILKRHGNHTEKYYKGNHSDNSGLSHWNIFLCCSRTLKSQWKFLDHTEKFSALLVSFVSRFLGVTLDFQCHNFIVNKASQSTMSLTVCKRTSPSEDKTCNTQKLKFIYE